MSAEEHHIITTQDGSHSVQSPRFGVSYHSRYGAVQESRHVFLKSGLYARLPELPKVRVLELGFGTGLNALLTWLEAEEQQKPIQYTSLEAYPITSEQVQLLNYPEALSLPSPAPFLRLHESEWGQRHTLSAHFTFEKRKERFEELQFEQAFDVVYFDAFAPNAQPELWTEELLSKVYRATAEGGVLVTYCAKGAVKRTLKGLGYEVEALPGPPGKREMTRAWRR